MVVISLLACAEISGTKMSKRPGFQYRMPRAKMPKLNITISSSQKGPAASVSNMPSNRDYARVPPLAPPPESADLWGDDDDELVMLASQVAEQVEAHAEQVLTQAMDFQESSITFERFRKEVDASTQLPKADDLINEFLCDNDDEDLFADVPDFNNVPAQPVRASTSKESDRRQSTSRATIEREPILPKPATEVRESEPTQANDKIESTRMEIRATFLSNKLRDQKKEIENLKDNLNDINEKCQTKEGEVIDRTLCVFRFSVRMKTIFSRLQRCATSWS